MKKLLNSHYAMLLAGVATGSLMAFPAVAQDAPEEPAEETIEIPAEPEDAESRQERVVVTGSLLRRDEFSSTSPIQVITSEVSTLEGLVDTADILQGSSVAAGSVQFNNQFNGFVVEGGTGINSISLRGLGAQRSLVLLNNRRPGPAGTRGQVGSFDLNVIPRSAITQVEILKDGASSIYGSDAVAGVANIITRTAVDRPEITVQVNQPFESGGESFSIDGAYGLNFDTGNIVLAAQYTLREDLSVGDRDFLRCPEDFVFDADTGERIDRVDGSVLAGGPLEGCQSIYHNTFIDALFGTRFVPSPDGVTEGAVEGYRPRANAGFDPVTGAPAFYEDVLDNPLYASQDAINKQDLLSLYATSDFEFPIFGGLNWDTEWLYTQRETTAEGWRQFFPLIGGANNLLAPSFTYANDPDFVNVGVASGLSQPVTIFPSNTKVEVDYFYVASGLDGEFGGVGLFDDWAWSLDATFSRSDGDYIENEILADLSGDVRFDADAPTYNPYTAEWLSGNDQAFINTVSSIEVGNTVYEQSSLTGVMTGPVFELPAGEVQLAIGAEGRQFSIDDQPSENSQAGNLWGTSQAQVTKGEDDVMEYFAEIEVPILAGQPFAEELSFNGSFRTFNYASYGTGDVYKVGANWQITPAFRVRGSTGTSYRAPALFELFLGNQTAFLSQLQIDPCIDWGNSGNQNIRANCASLGIPDDYAGGGSSATIISGGGQDVLEAETSDADTFGVIWTPTFADFSLAIDYFKIAVNDQVARLGAGTIVGGCLSAPNFPNAFCDLFQRNSADDPVAPFAVTQVNDSFLNVNSQETEGIDITARYEQSFDFGDIVGELQSTYTMEDIAFLFDSAAESGFDTDDFNGTIGDPEWVANGRISLVRGDWTYSWLFDYIGETNNDVLFNSTEFDYFGRNATQIFDADARLYHDVSVRWQGDTITVTGGIANLLDDEPPIISDGTATRRGSVPLVGGYDYRGRTGFVRATKQF